jgi:hypothetical protein
MFLIYSPFKGCQGCSNRSLIVHAVSMTPHALLREFEFIFEKALAPESGAQTDF